MTPPPLPVDPATLDYANPIADRAAVYAVLPHRGEMELLSGIVYCDTEQKVCVGFRDLSADEFWAKGQFPGYAVMPGVLMCEAAAQLACYYALSTGVVPPELLMGLGGIDEARFHRPVRPGERLVLYGQGVKIHRRLTRFFVGGTVNGEKAFEATVIGVPLGKWEDVTRA